MPVVLTDSIVMSCEDSDESMEGHRPKRKSHIKRMIKLMKEKAHNNRVANL